jgi:hypothetical protein
MRTWITTLVLLATVAPVAAQQLPDDTTVREAIAVTEARVSVAFPRLGPRQVARLTPTDLLVLEDARERSVTRIEHIDPRGGAPWTVLVYFDLALSEPDTPQVAAFALGALSRRLADLGVVHPLLARETSVERLPVARSAGDVELAMARISAERGTDAFDRLRLSARPRDVQAGRALLEESRLLRRRADLLVSEAAAACAGPPCLLLLVSDGFDLRTDLFHPGHAAAASGAEDPKAIAEEVGRVLSGLGFVVVGLPLRAPEVLDAEAKARLRQQRGAGTDYDDWRDHVAGARDGTTVSNRPEADPRGRGASGGADPYDTWILPELEPLRLWAVASSGRVLRVPQQLELALAELGERHFVYFRTERSPTGDLRPLELRFAARGRFEQGRRVKEVLGLVPDEEPLRHPRWIRSSIPPEVSAARLRRAALGDDLDGAATARRETAGVRARLVFDCSECEGKAQVRISRLDEDGAVQHRIVETDEADVEAEASGGLVRLPLEPDEATGPLIVQDLASGAWYVVG